MGNAVESAPERITRDRAIWWLVTGDHLLDQLLPTRDAVLNLVVQLATGINSPTAVPAPCRHAIQRANA